MTDLSVCYFSELSQLDPILYGVLSRYDERADRAEGKDKADGCITNQNWAHLIQAQTITRDQTEFLQAAYHHQVTLWNELSPTTRGYYLKGLIAAHQGNYTGASQLFNRALALSDLTHHEKTLFQDRLLWLDLFYEEYAHLETGAQPTDGSSSTPLSVYAAALRGYRAKDYSGALACLTTLFRLNKIPPHLRELAFQLRAEIVGKQESAGTSSQPHSPVGPGPLTADERDSYINFNNFKVVQNLEQIRTLFPKGHASLPDLIRDLQSLVTAGRISKKDIPWLIHVYFRAFLTFQASRSVRSAAEVFTTKKYDCSEYTETLQRVFDAFEIQSQTIIFWMSANWGHALIAYCFEGKWGFTSPLSFSRPKFDSLYKVCRAWEWARHSGVFHYGTYQSPGQFQISGYYEPIFP